MATFESRVNISKPVSEVYQFLADFNNHQQLMPENVQSWTSSYNEARFGIQNMVQLSLKIVDRIENESVKIQAVSNPPFPVMLTWSLANAGGATIATFVINAEMNMMMKMMASGPLQKLADHETNRLAAVIG